eukprot:397245-Pelagomonas_calceolata.AAC.6
MHTESTVAPASLKSTGLKGRPSLQCMDMLKSRAHLHSNLLIINNQQLRCCRRGQQVYTKLQQQSAKVLGLQHMAKSDVQHVERSQV